MGYPTKIATCNYCGTRAALVLSGTTRHELACGACGAPLHEMKMLPKKPDPVAKRYADTPSKRAVPLAVKKPKKKKKSVLKKALSEVFDVIEDIFD